MKNIAVLLSVVCSILFSFSALGDHPASVAVTRALDEGARILDMSGSSKKRAMCRFISRHIDSSGIANRWLGNYRNLERDRSGVRAFVKAAPSLMVTKAFPKMDDLGDGGTYSVNPNATRRSDGNFSVAVSITTNSGKNYSGRAIVSSRNKIVDVEYLGFSGVNYVGRDIKKELDAYYRRDTGRSLPASEFVRNLTQKSDYIACN